MELKKKYTLKKELRWAISSVGKARFPDPFQPMKFQQPQPFEKYHDTML